MGGNPPLEYADRTVVEAAVGEGRHEEYGFRLSLKHEIGDLLRVPSAPSKSKTTCAHSSVTIVMISYTRLESQTLGRSSYRINTTNVSLVARRGACPYVPIGGISRRTRYAV
jgi:hypothetical protein